ncbi:MFS allantoate transporter-like protein [Halenospora varia]|nr:MFS allantoate transporter-like protein [Halenospora varia]
MDIEKNLDASSGDIEKQHAPLAAVGSIEDYAEKTFRHVNRNDGDKALQAFEGHEGEEIILTPEIEKKLLRKIDLNIMPMLCTVYALNYLDKVTLSYASVMGIQKAIHLTSDNYQWLGSMFYIGYLFWEFPTARLLQRFPLGKWSGINVVLWGVAVSCMAATTNFKGAVAVRFFMGVFEAAVTPGFALFTSQWYTRGEQGLRVAIWFSFNGVAQIVGGALAYGISTSVKHYGNVSVLPAWKIIFVVTGPVTVAVGLLFIWLMPDSPLNAWFLSPTEKLLAVERIRKNQQGVGNTHFKWYQLKEAFLDPITWALFLFAAIGNLPNGIGTFFSQLIVSFGFTADESLLYGTPGGAVEVIWLIGFGWLGMRFNNRLFFGSLGIFTSLLGMLLIICLPTSQKVGRLIGYYLTQASPTGFVAVLSLISSNVAGYTKKTTVGAIILIGYCTGNIIAPQTFRPKDAPNYRPAEITIAVARLNRMNEGIRARPGYQKLDKQEFLDLTDRENHEFVYSL